VSGTIEKGAGRGTGSGRDLIFFSGSHLLLIPIIACPLTLTESLASFSIVLTDQEPGTG